MVNIDSYAYITELILQHSLSQNTPWMIAALLQKELQVMLVDDNVIDHFIINKYFQKSGFANPAMCFAGAAEALLFLRNASVNDLPHLIFLDINMPGMNGFDFLEAFALLDSHATTHCKIVMLSSSLNEEDIQRSTANAFVISYLTKPLTNEKLVEVFQKLVSD